MNKTALYRLSVYSVSYGIKSDAVSHLGPSLDPSLLDPPGGIRNSGSPSSLIFQDRPILSSF